MKRIICRIFHRTLMYAGGNYYECRRCFCRWPVPWTKKAEA